MCGIVGTIGIEQKEKMIPMLESIEHRGPNHKDYWFDEGDRLFLGHTRLSILDLSSAGHQPMIDENEKAIIIYNGEVYNFKDLRKSLIAEGYRFKSHSDTEVLLKLYLVKGPDMVKDLNGIFSFAIWDKKKKSLLMARDPLGVKPLYYYQDENHFLFASEMKSLLKLTHFKQEVSPRGALNYLSLLWSPGEETLLKGVKKVLPGEAFIIKEGKIVKKWFYYDLPVGQKKTNISFSDAVEQLDFHLEKSVERQMVSDVEVGAFLSGGLDSSSLCAYARKFSPKKLQCFTIDMCSNHQREEGLIDDLPFAQKAAKDLEVDLNIIHVDSEVVSELEKVIYFLDEPQPDPAILNTYFIAKLSREKNIKVLLSGAGGDDIFTGYRRHMALGFEKYWSFLPEKLRSVLSTSTSFLPQGHTLMRRISKAFKFAHLNEDLRICSYFLWSDLETQKMIFDPDFLRPLSYEHLLEGLQNSLKRVPEGASPLEKMLYLETKHFLCDHNLNYTDKMSMAHGVETRVPLLDLELVKFVWSLPESYKLRKGQTKYIFRKVMEKHLSPEIIYRPKTGFGAPLRSWMRGPLKPLFEETINSAEFKNRGIFNVSGIKKLFELDHKGKVDASYILYGVLCVELWLKNFNKSSFSLN